MNENKLQFHLFVWKRRNISWLNFVITFIEKTVCPSLRVGLIGLYARAHVEISESIFDTKMCRHLFFKFISNIWFEWKNYILENKYRSNCIKKIIWRQVCLASTRYGATQLSVFISFSKYLYSIEEKGSSK